MRHIVLVLLTVGLLASGTWLLFLDEGEGIRCNQARPGP